jgi:hypothetical protein
VSTSSCLRRRSRLLLAWVLPALVLRALVPFGFMPVASGGTVSMQLCPGHALSASGHDDGTHGAPHSGSGQGLCAFAASAAPPVAPSVFVLPVLVRAIAPAAVSAPAPVFLPAQFRAHSPRGPPLPA